MQKQLFTYMYKTVPADTLWHSSLLKKVVERESQLGLAVHMGLIRCVGWLMFFLTYSMWRVKTSLNHNTLDKLIIRTAVNVPPPK
jgi:hypothetical protein